jgi:cell division protein FtsL
MMKKQKKSNFSLYRLLFLIVVGYFIYVIGMQQYDILKIYQEESNVDVKLEQVKKENKMLSKEKEQLNDPAYIEKIAREELGLVKDGEIPYIPPSKH